MNLILIISLVFAASCSFKKNELANQTQNGHEELYSEPDKEVGPEKEDRKRLVIAATNDIGGALGTQAIKIRDNHNKDALHIEIGGADFLSSYFKILRDKYKSVILVDSGDFLPSESDDYPAVEDFYATLKYEALVPGLSDLSMRSSAGKNPIQRFAETSQVPVLTSNLYELKTARGIEWKGTSSYQMKEVNGINVGIIGLLPDDLASLTPPQNRLGLYIESALQSTLHQARRLRSLGAQVIVVLTHQGLSCGNAIAEAAKLPLSKVNFEPGKEGVCDLKSPLGTYLTRLPAKLVDVVVAGRNHRKTANLINGVAVISGFDAGKSFSYVELFIDPKTTKPVPAEMVIHQPVMVCREFFKETNDCYTEDPTVNHKERIPPRFLGVTVERDEEIRTKFKKFFDDVSVGQLPSLDDIRKKTGTDLIYRESSGDSHLVIVELTGKDLITWLERSYNLGSSSNWYPQPFSLKQDELELTIDGEDVAYGKTYRVLTDLGSLQERVSLRKHITSGNLITLSDLSWKNFSPADEVSVTAAGIQRQ